MPAPEPIAKSTQDFDHQQRQRLTEWRRQREKIAETSRQERQKQAETERQDRLRKIAKARIDHAVDQAETRSQEAAAAKAERLVAAHSKLANRSEIDAMAKRITAARRRMGRQRALRLAMFVVLPIALLATYLFAAAQPLYRAETRFALTDPTTRITAGMLRDIVASPAAIAFVDQSFGHKPYRRFSAADPLRQLALTPVVQMSDDAIFNWYVAASVGPTGDTITLTTRAPDQSAAMDLSNAVLAYLDSSMRAITQQVGGQSPVFVYQPTAVADTPTVANRWSWLALGTAGIIAGYILLSSAFSALRRHSVT